MNGFMLVRHKVKDFTVWKAGYDAHSPKRDEGFVMRDFSNVPALATNQRYRRLTAVWSISARSPYFADLSAVDQLPDRAENQTLLNREALLPHQFPQLCAA